MTYPLLKEYYQYNFKFNYFLNQVNKLDYIYEFGVFGGQALKCLIDECIKINKKPKQVIGMDSFIGLPKCKKEEMEYQKDWHEGFYNASEFLNLPPEEVVSKLTQEFTNRYPDINCIFIKGWFKDIILNNNYPPADFIHVDCDIYDSTLDCLSLMYNNHLLQIGTVLLYDDMIKDKEFQLGEGKAHIDFCQTNKIEYKHIFTNLIEITKI